MLSSRQILEQPRPDSDASRDAEAVARVEDAAFDNDTLSTIMRFHRRERLGFLEEALFSLSIQSWRELEVVIVIQNGDEQIERDIDEIINRQPWPAAPRYKILTINFPPGVDGRSTLLTRGIQEATGRYLAFLDDDDLVYQHGYKTLIQQLKQSGCAVAVGGCRTAKVQNVARSWYVQTKETPFAWGRTRNDLLRDNFIPIHSYVVDRLHIDPRELYFDDELPPLEDYDFLLRLCTKYEFDFSKLETPVCEYRIHGLNSIPYATNAPQESHASHLRAQQLINERKKRLQCMLPVSEFVEMLQRDIERDEQLRQKTAESEYLQWKLRVLEEEAKRRLLIRLAYRIYAFFGRFPRLEKFLSNQTHGFWQRYRKIKS
jgi:glycosyltransferase involved in cell wall biosynthesis